MSRRHDVSSRRPRREILVLESIVRQMITAGVPNGEVDSTIRTFLQCLADEGEEDIGHLVPDQARLPRFSLN